MKVARLSSPVRSRSVGARCALLLATAAAWLAGAPSLVRAEDTGVPNQHDAWARFEPGAWQHVRITTESLDTGGNVTSTTTTDKVTTLSAVAGDSVRLQVEVTAVVAGKRFDAPLQRLDQGRCYGEPVGNKLSVRDSGEASATIEGKTIPCRVRQYEITDTDQKRLVRVFYSANVAPYVLHRECVTTSLDGKHDGVHTQVDVIAVDLPFKVLKRIMPAAHVRTIQTTDTASTTSLSVQVMDVPGGIVSSSTKELDSEGHLVRRSTLELIDWGLKGDLDTNDKTTGRRRDARRVRRGHE